MRRCYTKKSDALKVFIRANAEIIQPWGGLHNKASSGEFDSVNERYGLRGKKKVNDIDGALKVVMPPGRPFCLDRMDLDTLNETRPALENGPFHLPYEMMEQMYLRGSDPSTKAFAVVGLIGLAVAIATILR